MALADRVRKAIRDVPDYPKPGVLFRDLTPVYSNPKLFAALVRDASARLAAWKPEAVAGIESRGFILGATAAQELGVPFVQFRKKGKLPRERISESFTLEYGEATIEAHTDSFIKGQRVAVVDDLLATGGTAAAACRLTERLGARVAGCLFIVELSFLRGRKVLRGKNVDSVVVY